jgi:hypothetical protein
MKYNGNCIVCNQEMQIKTCCNGFECGCMGQPLEPPVCSNDCYEKVINNFEKYYPKIEYEHPSTRYVTPLNFKKDAN